MRQPSSRGTAPGCDPSGGPCGAGPGGGLLPGTARDGLSEAVVDLSAIAHNTRVLAAHARGAVMAVVKANGFGHGAAQVARAALSHGADWLGVASTVEALALREAGITAPLLAWIHLPDGIARRR
ncbi:alanine racemase [Saccharothrix sp. ALI-22-I]|uniref:alanine racemase n=1 Tax=Saccharothrix sp. ALI-22-I TaxID=1933778 RepID=UPI0023799150|nr:alanine racemase [Saccharothrix sp. ALI-22-I]